jgi:hypothetical protein
MPGHGDTSRLDLAIRYPGRFLGLKAILPEGHTVTPGGFPTHLAFVRLPVFDPFRR